MSCGKRYMNEDDIFTSIPDNDVKSMPKPYPYDDELEAKPVPNPGSDEDNMVPTKPSYVRRPASRKNRTQKWLIILALVILIVAGVYYWCDSKKSASVLPPQIQTVEIDIPTPQSISAPRIYTTGKMSPAKGMLYNQ